MAYKKDFQSMDVRFVEGGSLSSDLSNDQIKASDWQRKDNWRRMLDAEVVREGWDFWRPNPFQPLSGQKFTGVASPVLAVEEIKNPAGNSVIVAVVGSTIRRFDFATGAWVQIGSGFSTYISSGGLLRRWQIVQLNGVAIFNNGVDLPVYWRIGMASVLPVYEMREKGVASVGMITEYSGFIMAADVTEVNSGYMSTLMNSGSPFGLVPSAATNTSRTQYRMIWCNATDALDWGAVVNYSGSNGSANITLAWPMPSFVPGMQVTLIGGGPSGGDLVTTIVTAAGTAVTVADALSQNVSNEPISATSAIGSPVGFYDIQDDGSAILAILPLQNRLVVYRPMAIFVGTYTGQTDFPFQFDRAYQGSRTPKLPDMLVNVRGSYHLYPGADFFYQYKLGSLEPDVDPIMAKCGREIVNFPYTFGDIHSCYASDNSVTGEIWFYITTTTGGTVVSNLICYDYNQSTASRVPSPPQFTSSAVVRFPMSGNLGNDSTSIFIMGDSDGNITQYGLTSLASTPPTMGRYGLGWTAQLETGLIFFGDSFNEKDLRTYVPLLKAPTPNQNFLVSSYFTNRTDIPPVLGTGSVTVQPNTAGLPTVVPLWQRGIYHKIAIAATVPGSGGGQLSLVGHIFEVDAIATRSVTRLK